MSRVPAFSFYLNLQVLAGKELFRTGPSAAVHGDPKYPVKPPNASDIGLSDSLWDFLELCWNQDSKCRPVTGEVVENLGKAAANWNTLMPPIEPKSGPVEVEPDLARPETQPRKYRNPPPRRSREDYRRFGELRAGEYTERVGEPVDPRTAAFDSC